VTAAAFSVDGKRVMTCSTRTFSGGASQLWDLRELLVALRLTMVSGEPQIDWDTGILQQAPTLQGPWADLPATSPFRLSTTPKQDYFRVKLE
jgi:hypothetical protein